MKPREKARTLRAHLLRLENLEIGRLLVFERLENRRMLSTIVQTETNSQGTVYTLTDAASGGWLEMQSAGSAVTQVIDTNVSRFGLDASGAAVALDSTGDLLLFPAGSASGSLMLAGDRNFVVDGDGVVTALQATSGKQWGTLYRFAPGSANAQPFQNQEFSHLVAALGYSVALGADGGLRYFPDNSGDARELVNAGSVSNFVVDGNGAVVAIVKSSSGSPAGELVRWSADAVPPTVFSGSYQAIALDGKGDVVALDASDPAHHLGTVWLVAPGSDQPQQMSGPDSTFLIDASGAVWTFEQLMTPNNWLAEIFVAGSNTQKVIERAPGDDAFFQQFELDGSGTVIALDVNGNLVRFATDGATKESEQLMDTNATEFVVDGAGYVVAEAGGALVQFATASNSAVTIDSGVTSMALDGTGAVVALNSGGQLDRFAPGSSVSQALDPNNSYVSFAMSRAGFVVALSSNGMLAQFLPGTSADAFDRSVIETSGVKYFYIDADGYLIYVSFAPAGLQSSFPYAGPENPLDISYNLPDPSRGGAFDLGGRGIEFDMLTGLAGQFTASVIATPFVNAVFPLNGEMLVSIADTQDVGSSVPANIHEIFLVTPGDYLNPNGISNYLLTPNGNWSWVTSVGYNSTDTGWTYTEVQGQPINMPGPLQIIENVGLFLAGVGLAILSDGTLAPLIEDGAGALGLGEGAADFVGSVVAGAVADSADQGLNIALNGGKFNWLEALAGGGLDWFGSDAVGLKNAPIEARAIADGVEEEVAPLVGALLPNGSGDSDATQAAEAANDFVKYVANDLQTSTISSTFLGDATAFLNDAPSGAADLPFLNPALWFLNWAAGENWTDSTFASFADSGASLLDRIAADGLGDTLFAADAAALLDQFSSQGLAGSALARGALSFLENSVSDQISSSTVVSDIANHLGWIVRGDSSFATTTIAAGLATFLGVAIPDGMISAPLSAGLDTLLAQIQSTPGIDMSPFAIGLGDFLNASPARLVELTTVGLQQYGTSPLVTGIGDFLQQAPADRIDLVNGPLADGLGEYLQRATNGWPNFTNGIFSDDIGAFLQQAVQDGASFLTSTFSTSVGYLLLQASNDATAFADPTLSGELGSFLAKAAQAGIAYANSSAGIAAATLLQQAAMNNTDFLNAGLINALDSSLPSGGGGSAPTTEVAYEIAAATGVDVVSAAGGLLQNAAGTGALSVVAGTVTGAEGGTFTFNADGSFTYTPPASFAGFDYANYTTTDAVGDKGTAAVNVLSQAGGVIWKFYEQVLHRDPDYAGLQGWIDNFNNGGTPGNIAVGFFQSTELLNQIISGYYWQYLGRGPTGNDLPFWENAWRQAGGPESIRAEFAISPEFNALAGNQSGANPAGWITALYQRILNRTPEPGAVPFWEKALTSGTSDYQVALDFVTSSEDYDNDVTGWYFEYLGRGPSLAEQAQYANQMLGGLTDRDIEEAITNLAEYSANPPASPPGTGVRLPDYFS